MVLRSLPDTSEVDDERLTCIRRLLTILKKNQLDGNRTYLRYVRF